VATGTGTSTRSRRVSEAARTWRGPVALLTGALLARVSPRLRKKLPSEAPKVEPPTHGRARVEPSVPLLGWQGRSLRDRLPALQYLAYPLAALMASEATSRARRTGRTGSDMTTLPTRTWEPCAALLRHTKERASLRPPLRMGQSLRSSRRREQARHRAKGGSWVTQVHRELSRRKAVCA
jgi:hypothetical protein